APTGDGFRYVVSRGKVDVGVRAETREQPGLAAQLELVPAHVRRANPGGEALHPSGKDAQTRYFRRLLARFEQRLHAETNPQKRHARPEALEEGIADRQPLRS